MKRTDFVTRLISVILFIFLALYLGIYFFQSMTDPLTTALAIKLPAEEAFSADGIIVREESVILAGGNIVSSAVRDGEKVSAGQQYLTAYGSEEERERDVRRGQLEQEIAQLEELIESGTSLDQVAEKEAEIKRQIQELNYAVGQSDLGDLEQQLISLRSMVFSGDSAAASQRLSGLYAELADLGGVGSTTKIYADQSGVYSSTLDGFEDLTLDDVANLDADGLSALLDQERTASQAAAGKLVTGITWYYAAVVDEDEDEGSRLEDMLSGDTENQVTVVFSGADSVSVPMRVHALGDPAGGGRVAIFSSSSFLAETISLRQTEARVVYSSFDGIRVPTEAIHEDEEGLTYLYTLTGTTAEQKYVTIIYEGPDYCLVEPDLENTSSAAAFREGNTIIVRGRDLYDGKVVT